ncbi:MAG: alpha/beta hydrolase [Wujia sp.]
MSDFFDEDEMEEEKMEEDKVKTAIANENEKNDNCDEPVREISRRAKIVQGVVAEFNRNSFLRTKLRDNTRPISDIDKSFNYPDYIDVKRIDLGKFPMELVSRKDCANGKVVLQLHGGGYVGAFKNIYRTMAGLYSEVSNGAAVLTIDYRVAPENPFPAALEDAYEAYHWLLDSGYRGTDIVFAGDSAGGGLVLCLCHYLKGKGEQLPAGIVVMSPWTDLTCSGESYTENHECDALFGNEDENFLKHSPYIGQEDPRNPLISPLFGDFTGFPPMLIQVGTNEMLLSDSKVLAEKVKAAGCKVRYTEYEGMFHVFQMGAKLMPESQKAWVEVGKFFDAISEM